MIIHPILIVMFFTLMAASMVFGSIRGYKMRCKLSEKAPVLIVTRPCGLKESQNSDILFAEAMKNKDFALSVILKLI